MGTEYIISWKSSGVYNSKLIPLNSDFLLNTKRLRNRIII